MVVVEDRTESRNHLFESSVATLWMFLTDREYHSSYHELSLIKLLFVLSANNCDIFAMVFL